MVRLLPDALDRANPEPVPFAFGILALYLPFTTYLVDCYPDYAASAVAANTVFRNLLGAFLPLAGPRLYQTLGLGWGNSLLGFILHIYGSCPSNSV